MFIWKKCKIFADCKIRDALETINKQGLRIALVVDKQDYLLGVITDGDIRRALLNGAGLEDSVFNVMNKNPITAEKNFSRASLVEQMNELDILSIPILDGKKLIGLETLKENIENESKRDNPVFLMAGGFGKRLRPQTNECPKPMLLVGDRPILEIIVRRFIKAGFWNFFISTHYKSKMISDHFGDGTSLGVSISYIEEEKPLGTGGSLGLLPDDLPDELPLFVMNGDLLTEVDFLQLLDFHNKSNAIATICVREFEYQVPYGVVTGDGSTVVSIEEKPIHRFSVNAGIYVVSQKVIGTIDRDIKIDMPTLLESKINDSQSVAMFPLYEYWLDIGRLDDLKKANKDVYTLPK